MARKRMIAQSLWTNRRFIRLNNTERILFIGLITIADDEGRLWNDGLSIKAKIFPVDNIKVESIIKMLGKIAKLELIVMNDDAIELIGWNDYQKIRNDMFVSSDIPSPLHERNMNVTSTLHERNNGVTNTLHSIDKNRLDKTKVDKSIVQNSDELLHDFDVFWNLYDKKINRSKCEAKWKRLKSSDKSEIMNTLPAYIESTPDIQFRKHPLTYLNNEGWKDVIIKKKSKVRSNMERIMSVPLP